MDSFDINFKRASIGDLPDIRSLILPEYHPMKKKLLKVVAKNWVVQAVLIAAAALAYAIIKEGFLVWIVAYIFLNALTLFATSVIFNRRIATYTKDLWDWEVCRQAYSEGLWVAEIRSGELKSEVVACYALDMRKNIPTAGSGELTIELKRASVASHVDQCGLGRELLQHALKQATCLGYTTMMVNIAETSHNLIRLFKEVGFRTESIKTGLVAVHVLHRTL